MSLTSQVPAHDLDLPPVPVRRFTVDEYLRMVTANVFDGDDRHELLAGWVVSKMTRNPPHEVGIALADEALRALLPAGWRLRNQSSITTADSVPEPDLSVVRGAIRDYIGRHPGPQDMALAIEVADSSLPKDRNLKGRIYARAGIPVYWIINLVDRKVEVYTDPTGPALMPGYRQQQEYGPGAAVPLVIDGREVARVAVDELLP
jgi:Uma2 family endonuclease